MTVPPNPPASGTVITSAWGTSVVSQLVLRFPDAAARTAALPSPTLNQLTVLDSSPGTVTYWSGTAWLAVQPAQRLHQRFVNMAFVLNVPNNGNATVDLSGMVFPMTSTFLLQMFCELTTATAGANQQVDLTFEASTVATPVTPAVAPATRGFILNGTQQIPVGAVYRNVAANTAWHARIRATAGPGGTNLTWSKIWGITSIIAPGQEFP